MGKLSSAVDQALAWALMLLGVVHDGVGLANFEAVTPNWLWFMGSGLALFAVGALNLARRWSGGAGVALLCLVADVLLLAFAVVASTVFFAEMPVQAIMLTSLSVALTSFSLKRLISARQAAQPMRK